ncbi:clostripain-related cysteine peptidase [uncultured Butyricimonas sp.]|uniref:clostripain-related cysteine peptidase n=1 Tax=uncultured Butyricimonas sp. TaxID=1268785 RepID=UPI0026DD7F96|nr:clostripain-related cysteine peptidase [uncultured Butyricimonas sp.]
MRLKSRYFIQYILCVAFFFMVSCEKDENEPEKVRTLMVYLAGNNNLSGHLKNNIKDMASAWKKSYNGDIVIFFDGSGSVPQLLTFKVKDGVVEQEVLKTYDELNSASPETLKQVVKDMQALYPSDSYGMIFGSHATGWIPSSLLGRAERSLYQIENPLTRSFATDGASTMDIRDMAAAIPDGMDFIVFDACLMSSIETLYEFRNKAKYVIASPAETPAPGFPYAKMMPYFWREGDRMESDLEEVCKIFYEYYNTYNSSDRFGTIALINMSELDNLYDLTCQVLEGKAPEAAQMGKEAVYNYPKVEYDKYDRFFDLREYIRYMTVNDAALRAAYEDLLGKVVLYKAVTDPFYRTTIPVEKFSGISTYIPRSEWYGETNAYWKFPWAGVYGKDATE